MFITKCLTVVFLGGSGENKGWKFFLFLKRARKELVEINYVHDLRSRDDEAGMMMLMMRSGKSDDDGLT